MINSGTEEIRRIQFLLRQVQSNVESDLRHTNLPELEEYIRFALSK